MCNYPIDIAITELMYLAPTSSFSVYLTINEVLISVDFIIIHNFY